MRTRDKLVSIAALAIVTMGLLLTRPVLSQSLDMRHGTRVLHFGDSFVTAGLSQRLRAHFKELGVTYEAHARASSTTYAWAYGKDLPKLVAKKPDLVIVTLGANEMFIGHPEERAKAIRAIVKKLGNRPCIWAAPPPWKKQTGILDVIRDNAGPCLYFDSEAEVAGDIARRKDGIHPSLEGGRVWADALFRFIEERRKPEEGPWALEPRASSKSAPRPPGKD